MADPIFPEIITKEQIKLGVDVRPNTAAPIVPYTGPKSPVTAKPFVRTMPVQVVPSDLVLPTDNLGTGIKSITRVPSSTVVDTIKRDTTRRFGGSLLRGIGGKILGGAGIISDILLNPQPTVSGAQEAEAIRQAEELRRQQQQDTLPSLPPLEPVSKSPTTTTDYNNPFDIRPRSQPSDSPIQPSDRVTDSPVTSPSPYPLTETGGGVNLTRPILEELLKQREEITKIQEEIKLFPPLINNVPTVIAPMIQEVVTFTGGGFVTTIDTITKIQTNTYIEIPKSPSTVVSIPVIGGGGIVSIPTGGGGFVSVPRTPETIFSIPQNPSNIVSIPKDNGSFIAIPKDCNEVVAVPQTCNNFVAVPILASFDECCEEIKKKLDELFPRIEGSGELVCGEDEEGNPLVTQYQYSNYGLLGLRDAINTSLQVLKQVLTKVCDIDIEYPLVEGELNYSCQTGTDEDGNPIIETVEQAYTGLGFAGLQDQIAKLAAVNQAILDEVCELENNEEPYCYPILPDARFEEFSITTQLTITFGEQYPTQKGSLWHLVVPNPIANLDWCTHFDNLFINCGSRYNAVYGRILWADTKTATSAWFESEETAEMILSYLLSLSTSPPRNPVNPIRITKNGVSRRSRETPFTIRAVKAAISFFNEGSFDPSQVICLAPPPGGCNANP
jgi:hypothetical protein